MVHMDVIVIYHLAQIHPEVPCLLVYRECKRRNRLLFDLSAQASHQAQEDQVFQATQGILVALELLLALPTVVPRHNRAILYLLSDLEVLFALEILSCQVFLGGQLVQEAHKQCHR